MAMGGTSFLRKLSSDRHNLLRKKKPRDDEPTAQTGRETIDDSIDSQDGMLEEDGERPVFSYRLSCSACDSGAYYVNQTEDKVATTLMEHYEDLWALIEDARGGLACWDMNGVKGEFGKSALARHLMTHTQFVETKNDMMEWCQRSVRVQIRQHLYVPKPKTDRTLKFRETQPKFVANKQKKETKWEATKVQRELDRREHCNFSCRQG